MVIFFFLFYLYFFSFLVALVDRVHGVKAKQGMCKLLIAPGNLY